MPANRVGLATVALAVTGFVVAVGVFHDDPPADPAPRHDPTTRTTPSSTATQPPASRPRARTATTPLTRKLKAQRIAAERKAMDIPITIVNAVPEPEAPDPTVVADLSGNKAIGYQLMLDVGFSADQWPALEALWSRESGWNQYADNPSSTAYGIPQALPGSKMAAAGPDWETNPTTQITWGLSYIRARYGTPKAALAHSDRKGWY